MPLVSAILLSLFSVKICIVSKSFGNLSLECARSTISSSEIGSDTVKLPNGLFLSHCFKTSWIHSSSRWTHRGNPCFVRMGKPALPHISSCVLLSWYSMGTGTSSRHNHVALPWFSNSCIQSLAKGLPNSAFLTVVKCIRSHPLFALNVMGMIRCFGWIPSFPCVCSIILGLCDCNSCNLLFLAFSFHLRVITSMSQDLISVVSISSVVRSSSVPYSIS